MDASSTYLCLPEYRRAMMGPERGVLHDRRTRPGGARAAPGANPDRGRAYSPIRTERGNHPGRGGAVDRGGRDPSRDGPVALRRVAGRGHRLRPLGLVPDPDRMVAADSAR